MNIIFSRHLLIHLDVVCSERIGTLEANGEFTLSKERQWAPKTSINV